MHHYTRVEGGDVYWKLYWRPVFTEGAEPQVDGEIAPAYMAHPKAYPDLPMAN